MINNYSDKLIMKSKLRNCSLQLFKANCPAITLNHENLPTLLFIERYIRRTTVQTSNVLLNMYYRFNNTFLLTFEMHPHNEDYWHVGLQYSP